jgi:hypothetical protein
MRAHLFVDGGGMVTGTHDIKTARRLIVDVALEQYGDYRDRYDIASASAAFQVRKARLETGRVVPNNPENGDPDYSWFWRSGYELGKPGVTRAVVWS